MVDLPHRDIKFTTTDDGVGIAYWEIGSGMPLVIVNNWTLSHAELEWTLPSVVSFYIELAAMGGATATARILNLRVNSRRRLLHPCMCRLPIHRAEYRNPIPHSTHRCRCRP